MTGCFKYLSCLSFNKHTENNPSNNLWNLPTHPFWHSNLLLCSSMLFLFYHHALVWLSCHSKCWRSIPLTKQILVFTHYWRTEAQGISRYSCFGVPSGLQTVLCLHAVLCTCVPLVSLFIYTFLYIHFHKQQSNFMKSHCKNSISKYSFIHKARENLRDSAQEFEVTKFTP